MPYNTLITRDASDDPLVPTPVSSEIISELPGSSAVMALSRRVTMAAGQQRMPVMSVLPAVYWVAGDTGLKQTTTADWENVTLKAEELAVLVPIPNAYIDDAQVPIWSEVRPHIVGAIAAQVDAAVLFGVQKPVTWPTDIFAHAVAAGNTTAEVDPDPTVAVAQSALKLVNDGFTANGFATQPGIAWRFAALRTTQGAPLYVPDVRGTPGGTLYGYNLREVSNGAWDSTKATIILGDWTKSIVGVRQDITFSRHEDAVVSDAGGLVVFNAMQQDSVIYRVVFRVAWAMANPVTRLQVVKASRSPFSVVTPDITP